MIGEDWIKIYFTHLFIFQTKNYNCNCVTDINVKKKLNIRRSTKNDARNLEEKMKHKMLHIISKQALKRKKNFIGDTEKLFLFIELCVCDLLVIFNKDFR